MYKKLIFLTSLVPVLILAGTNLALGDVWEAYITQETDDTEELDPSGTPEGSSGDLEFPYEDAGMGDKQLVGIRWENVEVPKGATILDAWIEFTVDELDAGLHVSVIIEGELNPNPPTFTTSTPSEIADRQPRTTAQAIYEPEPWTTVGAKQQTSDISPVIQEIIDQPDWVAGNALVLIIRDNPANPSTGKRVADAYGGGEGNMALLHIEYTLGNATGPHPADGAVGVPRDTDLSWNAGALAEATDGHTVYFGESFNDVNNGIGGVTQSATAYDPGRLNFGTTYYWRVRENNGPPNYGVNEGKVWSFTTELFAYPIENIIATASSAAQADLGPENTVNGSGLDENDLHSAEATDMWLSGNEPQEAWIEYEFDRVYKLHEMWVWNSNQMIELFIGYGFKDVTIEYSSNGTDYTTLGTTHQFAQAPGADGYAHNTTIDFGGAAARYVRLTANSAWGAIMPQYGLSEVRFFYVPVNATKPHPAPGTTGVNVDVTLGWVAGREAAMHDVYVSADEQAVIDGTAPVATATETSYRPPALDLDTTYYWKVNEVNEAETPSSWESDIWSFTTTDHLVVDDFESYNDLDPSDPESNRIFAAWVDGYEDPTNGSLVGHDSAPFCEQTIVYGGKQSMPFFYSNTAGAMYSEATRTFALPQDWTKHDIQTLGLWFQGTEGSTGQLYMKINGVKVAYDGDAANLTRTWWHQWNIELASVGTTLQNITTLSIGIDGNGAGGTLYIDDIGLYALAPAPPAPVNEWRITASSDDAEEHIPAGGVDLNSSDLELPYEGAMAPESSQIIGCRWTALPIPKGATITEAWVQFSADDIDNDYHIPNVSLIIEGELSPNPTTFSSTLGDISSRPATTAKVVWDVPQWTTVNAQSPEERTPDISRIIQEIVNQDGWIGNAIVLKFRDNPANPSQGTREAESFDGSGSEAPLLHIDYQ